MFKFVKQKSNESHLAIKWVKLVTLITLVIKILAILDFKQHQCRGDRNKLKQALRKAIIQRRFRTKLHIRVDMPRDSGHGTTNDGYVNRIYLNLIFDNLQHF